MTTIAFDNETFLIGPAQVAPRLVCVSWSQDGESAEVVHGKDPAAYRLARWWLEESSIQLVGQNVPFDLGVWAQTWPDLLDLIFQVYRQDRIVDTMVRQKLIDISKGEYRGFRNGLTGQWVEYKYHLADLAKRHKYREDLDKDTWRLRYSELYDTPVDSWPEGAIEYSRHDAMSTWHVWNQQQQDRESLEDQYRQSRYHWALHLVSAWGVRTDRVMVDRLEELTKQILEDHRALLLREGLLELKGASLVKKVKRAQEYATKMWEARGGAPESCLTDTGKVSLSEDAAKALGDPLILAFQEYSSAATILARVEELRAGVDMPIHTRFDELMDSGRTSSSKPNIQNRTVEPLLRSACGHAVDRKSTVCKQCSTPYQIAGDRECFVPRQGNVFYIADVPGLELRTIAQKCIAIVGYSKLGERLNAGEDPHLAVAAGLLGISIEEAKRRKKDPDDVEIYLGRQTGKVVNFGLDALLGWQGLIQQARTKYDLHLTERTAKRAIEVYFEVTPEMKEFHAWVKSMCQGGVGTVEQLYSGRIRGLVPPTVAANTLSQGLGADATKAGLYDLIEACYLGEVRAPYYKGSEAFPSLWGSRVVNYVHDEYHLEGPEDEYIEQRSTEMADVLCNAINQWLPDVPVPRQEMRPLVCRRWSKKATHTKDGSPWEWEVARALGSPGFAGVF